MTGLTTRRPPRALAPALAPALALALAAGLAACGRGGAAAEAEGKADGPGVVVGARTAAATVQPFTETIGAIGTVAARPGHVATLGAPAATRVTRVHVTVGQRVAAGQPLVELDRSAFEAAAQSADAALAAAESAHERQQRLLREGIAPRKDAEQAGAELARARADAVAARRLAQLAVLRAPIPGVVTALAATLGASVDVNQTLVEVADPSALDVILGVTPGDAPRVRAGAAVALAAGQSAAGEPVGTGTVADVAGTVDSATRSVAVRVRVPAAGRPLRIGETVFGQIAVATRPRAITVPLEALVPEGEGFKLFVVDSGGVAHERPVAVGGRTDRVAEITDGLAAGERVVTYGAYGVEDSAKIVPLPPPPQQQGRRPSPAGPAGAKGEKP